MLARTAQATVTCREAESRGSPPRRPLIPVLLSFSLLVLSGCAGLPEPQQDAPPTLEPEAHEEPPEVPEVAIEPDSTPSPSRSGTGASRPFSAAIVLSDRSRAFEVVASELGYLLEEPLVYNLADKSQSPEEAFAGIASSGAQVVIAIGFSATRAAVRWSTVPVVYCQVFNSVAEGADGVPVKGVAATPPLAVQLGAWKGLDPDLRSVGAILGEGHQDLVAEAALAAKTHGLAFHHQTAGSDRETLYFFKRLAPDIDGFWLFPDNRVLSVPALREIVDIAARHHVRIAVFNEALLEIGVSLSTAPVESDIAATVLAVAAKLVSGDAQAVPELTPLNEVKLRTASLGGHRADSAGTPANAAGVGRGRL